MDENEEAIQNPIKSWDEYKAEMVKEDENQKNYTLKKFIADVVIVLIVAVASVVVYSFALMYLVPIVENTLTFGVTDLYDVVYIATGLFLVTLAQSSVDKMIKWIWEA
ncbi:hypothetical protein ACRHK7_00425 [Weissella tructae]|uniref:hypothetical protein n=1 Tax=Weissella tructae TaxID=887702 RepID=UPI003D8FF90D